MMDWCGAGSDWPESESVRVGVHVWLHTHTHSHTITDTSKDPGWTHTHVTFHIVTLSDVSSRQQSTYLPIINCWTRLFMNLRLLFVTQPFSVAKLWANRRRLNLYCFFCTGQAFLWQMRSEDFPTTNNSLFYDLTIFSPYFRCTWSVVRKLHNIWFFHFS